MFIDSHAHLDSADFDSDRAQVIERARTARVERILAIRGRNGPGSLDQAICLAEQYPELDATIGIHPHEAKLASTSDFTILNHLSDHPKVVAWGEIGLDFHYHNSPQEIQEEVFIRQLSQASAKHLPVIIHTREAEEETLRILREHWAGSGLGGVLHCFTGTRSLAEECLDMGFLISFSGILTFPKAQPLREIARGVPLDRLLIETDCPYLAPVPYRGKRNEPAFVLEAARVLAELKGLSFEEVGRITSINYERLFGKGRARASGKRWQEN